jgi:hypothetical protein
MRRLLTFAATLALCAVPVFAQYTVVLRDGTTYKAKEKWKVVNGQALISLESGTQISLDPRMIDIERTEQANRLGLGDAKLIKVEERTADAPRQQQQPLGSVTTLRRDTASTSSTSSPRQQPATSETLVGKDTLSKFQRAYNNVGLFGATVTPSEGATLTVTVTANTEDEVFKAISATAFLMSRLDDVETVHLLMATLTGGAAGKFEMTRGDAKAISDKHLSWQSYYVQKVIF